MFSKTEIRSGVVICCVLTLVFGGCVSLEPKHDSDLAVCSDLDCYLKRAQASEPFYRFGQPIGQKILNTMAIRYPCFESLLGEKSYFFLL
jgi:hypothetical protein